MKYLPLSITISLLLMGCQTTGLTTTSSMPLANEEWSNEEMASVEEINLALLSDDSFDVIHPVEDLDITLSDNDTVVTDDIWQRLRTQLTFTIPDNHRIAAQRDWYVNHPGYLDRVAKRAEPFLYYIMQELEANNIPVEMALLPIVESAFDPFAYSHGRASGMWQFVPGTGTRFGMKQNWWYDGRRDVVASTQGAIKYLQYLHEYFEGDWLLALAAYNSGEGRVKRAMKNNARKKKATDFWSLDLPKETQAYVPKLLALADIVKRPEFYGIKLYELENKSVISQIAIDSQIDLAKAAALAAMPLAELQRLNPGFNRWATDPDGPHYLLIPNHKVAAFNAGLATLQPEQRLSWQRYQIKFGDSLIKIAGKFHTSPELIKAINAIQGTEIRAGKFLLIPVSAVSLDNYVFSQEQRLENRQNKPRVGDKTIHVVKRGDTFWDLSRAYHVSTQNLAQWNGMSPKDPLKLGQKLVIWQKSTRAFASQQPNEQAVMRNITYKVRAGDSFARIADKFNVLIKDIERWNKLNRANYLQPGQLLKLSIDVTNNI